MQIETAPVAGVIAPAADGVDAPYWEGLARGVLLLQRCPACSAWVWGPQWTCPTCQNPSLQWEEVEMVGSVYSWTRTWQPFAPEFAGELPYVSVLVELPNAGARRLLGLLLGDPTVDPRIGEPVRGRIQQLEDGVGVLRWERSTA